MTFKPLTPSLSVAAQLTKDDVARAAQQGFKAIIDNRPDDEEVGQLNAAEMERLAADHGMVFVHIPVVSGKIDDASVAKMGAALDSLEGPVLAYCRTGTRSTNLWALSQAGRVAPDAIMSTAKAAGYDLSSIASRLGA
jgi:sulfide:quinone oxidoreductase